MQDADAVLGAIAQSLPAGADNFGPEKAAETQLDDRDAGSAQLVGPEPMRVDRGDVRLVARSVDSHSQTRHVPLAPSQVELANQHQDRNGSRQNGGGVGGLCRPI